MGGDGRPARLNPPARSARLRSVNIFRDSRLWIGTAVVFGVRAVYGGVVHGPWVLTPLMYARMPTGMTRTLHLPALFAVELLIALLFVGAYRVRFPTWRADVGSACRVGAWFGVVVYVPQNLLNVILLEPVRWPLAATWAVAGIVGCVIGAAALATAARRWSA